MSKKLCVLRDLSGEKSSVLPRVLSGKFIQSSRTYGVSRDDVVNHVPVHIGQTPVDAVVSDSQFFVIDPQQS